jgi:hypothetical protein
MTTVHSITGRFISKGVTVACNILLLITNFLYATLLISHSEDC